MSPEMFKFRNAFIFIIIIYTYIPIYFGVAL